MLRSGLLHILTFVCLAACGGGGGGADPVVESRNAYHPALTELDSLYRHAFPQSFTDLSRLSQSGQVQYQGRLGIDAIGRRSTISRDELYQFFDAINDADVIAHPDMIARMTLTANFGDRTVSGRISDFIKSNGTPQSGEVFLTNSLIDDGYYHFNGNLSGEFGGRPVSGLFVGDFLGSQATMIEGGVGFIAGGDGYAGMYILRQ